MDINKSLEKNLPRIRKLFPTGEKLEEFFNTPKSQLEEYNVGLGTLVRLKLLRSYNGLYMSFMNEGITNKDKMSMEIINYFHDHGRSYCEDSDES